MDETTPNIGKSLFKTVSLIVGVCFLLYMIYVWYRIRDEYTAWQTSLEVMSEMQYRHLTDWQRTISADIDHIAADTSYVIHLNDYTRGNTRKLSKLTYPLRLLSVDSQYVDILVLNRASDIIYDVSMGTNVCVLDMPMAAVKHGFGLISSNDTSIQFVTYKASILDKDSLVGYIVAVLDPKMELLPIASDLPIDKLRVESHLYSVEDSAVRNLTNRNESIRQSVVDIIMQNVQDVDNDKYGSIQIFDKGQSKTMASVKKLPNSQWIVILSLKIKDIRNSITNALMVGFLSIVGIAILMLVFSILFHEGIKRGTVSLLLRREASLRIHARELQTVLDNISDAIITCDKNGRIWHMNSIAQQLTGFTQRRVIGHNILSIFNISTGNPGNLLEHAMHGYSNVELPSNTMLLRKDGQEVPVSGSLSPIINDLKKYSGLVVTFRDTSDSYYKERILEQGVESYDMIFDRNPHPMCVYEIDTHKIVKVNQAACDLIGYSHEELLSMTLLDFSTPQFTMLMENTSAEVRAKLLDMDEWEVIRRDGERITLSKTAFDLMFNGKLCRHLLITDMTQRRLMQHDMLGSQKRYKKMMNNLPEAVIVQDADNIITFANQSAMSLFGATEKKQLVGKNISMIFHPDVFDSIKSRINEIKSGQNTVPTDERTFVKLDGTEFQADVTGTSFVESGKMFIQVLVKPKNPFDGDSGINGDEYRNLGNLGDLLIWKLDAGYNFIYYNDAWKRFVGGYGSKLGQGTEWINLIHPDDRDSRVYKYKEICERREPFQTELRLLNDNGNYYWMLINAAPNYDAKGVYLGYMGYCININRRRVAEIEMEKAKEMAEESASLKTTFLATLSHEIRTPMNAVIGFVDCMKTVKSLDKIDYYLDVIHDNVYRLLTIVNDTMEVSKIETNQLEINVSSFNVNMMAEDVYLEIKDSAQKHVLIFNNNLPSDLVVSSDKGKVKSVLVHLLDNAIKYTPVGGTITFEANYEEEKVLFSVADTGIGFDIKEKNRIFEAYYRISNPTTMQVRGLGLGLPISKAYMDKIGGEIKLQSSLGIGTIATVTVPNTTQKSDKKVQAQLANYFLKKSGTVLIAEDDEFSSIYTATILESNGCKVKHVYDGDAAVRAVKEMPEIRLVFMDLQMPIMDGFEALGHIKKMKPDLPVVAQTNFSISDFEYKLNEFRFDGVLNKPVKKDLLLSIVEHYLKPER